MIRAADLADRLASVADSVAAMLLPNGVRHGREWCVGSVDGEAGDSMKVCISGGKAGVWSDFATGKGGDLIDLWAQTKGLSIAQAMAEAKDYLGLREARVENPPRRYTKPSREGVTALAPQHAQWLAEVRKIGPEVQAKFKLASRKGAIMFPYIRDGELVAAKYRKVPAKDFFVDADCEPALFGWQALKGSERAVVLVEGEMDALAMAEYGVPALSVPFGGGSDGKQVGWIDAEFDRLAQFDWLFLAMDTDDAGQQATDAIIKRLGRERCRVVELPHKDANECLVRGVPRETILAALRAAQTRDPESLKQASEYADDLAREFRDAGEPEAGIYLPWRKVGGALVLREAEVSIWAGINGHGKSQTIGHVAAYACKTGSRVCVASMEFKPVKWLKRLVRQITAQACPGQAYVRYVSHWFHDKLWAFTATGAAKADVMLETFAYAARRYGIDLFVIDNLAKCGFAEDDYNGQKAFVDTLTDFAREYGVHIALVCHMRKSDSEDRPGGKMGVKGSGAIVDMADTLMEVWRNKPKEEAIRVAKAQGGEVNPEVMDKPDALLTCRKQRNGEDEPKVALWFDKGSCQYLEGPHSRAYPLVEFSAMEAAHDAG